MWRSSIFCFNFVQSPIFIKPRYLLKKRKMIVPRFARHNHFPFLSMRFAVVKMKPTIIDLNHR